MSVTKFSLISTLILSLVGNASDLVTLKNGDTLTGKITDSDQSGVYFLSYTDSTTPLKIKEEFISSISFAANQPKPSIDSEKILLRNGDYFPCRLELLDENTVTFNSQSLGKHSIPRTAVQRIYFNNKAQNIIYQGPKKDPSDWKADDRNIKFKDGKLSTSQKIKISKNIDQLPENFLFEFKVKWTGDSPRLKIFFCSESKDLAKKLDSFIFDMNFLEFKITHFIKRRYKSMGEYSVDPKIYTSPTGKVSLYVNRKNKEIVLYYNGQKVQKFEGEFASPKGSNVIFQTLQRTSESVTISDIKFSTWQGGAIISSSDNNENLKQNDMVTDINGNPMTGKLSGIANKEGKLFLNFNIPFSTKPSVIPQNQIQSIDLQQAQEIKSVDQTRTLSLVQGGIISYNKSQIVDGKISLDHSLMGNIQVDKALIDKLEIKETTQTK